MKKIALITFALITACAPRPQGPPNEAREDSIYFFHGRPEALLANAEAHNKSFITVKNYTAFNGFYLSSGFIDTSHSFYSRARGPRNIKAGQEPNKTLRVRTIGEDDTYSMTFNSSTGLAGYQSKIAGAFTFGFTADKNGNLNLTKFNDGKRNFEIDPDTVYYSMHKNQEYFSLSFPIYYSDGTSQYLTMHMAKTKELKWIQEDTRYYYMVAAGVRVGWDQSKPVELSLCGIKSKELKTLILESIDEWKKHLQGRLEIQTKIYEAYPPYLDLNSHCIYLIEDFQTKPEPEFKNTGATRSAIYDTILDSDIFLLKREIDKYTLLDRFFKYPDSRNLLKSIIIHEIGHFLGLAHQFDEEDLDKKDLKQTIPSIMGYDERITSIQSYDIQAIQYLYPFKKSK